MSEALEKYRADRESLIAEDRALRVDSRRTNNLTELELKADAIFRDLRAKEAQSIWSQDHPEIAHPFPGMEFLTGKAIITKTKLFELIQKVSC